MRKLLLLLLLSLTALHAQTIKFTNPNFEGTPNHSSLPKPWTDCGFPNESPPDTHPDYIFGVSNRAYAGKTYLGMVTRDNNTWEAVSGALSAPLLQDSCYRFEIALAVSASYISISRETQTTANSIAPTKLRIWGSSDCQRLELLAESEPLGSPSKWKQYRFEISPRKGSYSHVVLEAYYALDGRPTNGNLLLDAASGFEPCADCCTDAGAQPTEDLPFELALSITPEPPNMRTSPDAPYRATLPYPLLMSDPAYKKELLNQILSEFPATDYTTLPMAYLTSQYPDGSPHPTLSLVPVYSNPALYTLAHTLAAMGGEWVLVLHHDDDAVEKARSKHMAAVLAALGDIPLTVRAYDARIDGGVSWEAKSLANGVFLRAR
jgi:hypothetical protein